MDFEPDDNILTMYDEDGNETNYQIISAKEVNESVYMLVEVAISEDAAEVLIFKCIANDEENSDNEDDDEMIFEVVDEDHESFAEAFELFKDDMDELEIGY